MFLFIKRMIKPYFITSILMGAIIISGCGSPTANFGGTDVGNPGPSTFNSWDGLETYIKSEFSESALPSELYSTSTWLEMDSIAPAFGDVTANVTSEGYSQTNVQETEVDEADKIKTDGEYLYVTDDNAVHIVNAAPADSMSYLSTISVSGNVDSIYLYNDTLIILYKTTEWSGLSWAMPDVDCRLGVGLNYCLPIKAQTGVLIVDVSDPLSPEKIKEWTIDGWMVSSRLINSRLHIIQRFLPDLPPLQLTYDGTEEDRAETIAANDQTLESIALGDLIPYFEVVDNEGIPSESAPLIIPEDFYQPNESNGGSIVSIVSFNLNNPSGDFQSLGLIADAHTVYASTQALYIASSQWNHGVAIEQSDDYFKTYLYKFGLTGGTAELEGTGEVKGRTLNQFSMGEYDDVLRIATSTGAAWGATTESNIYCLEGIDDRLEVIGALEGLAPGEDIYSARFIGTRGFLVTFVKIDPLFTIDLSDPTNPVVAGELKVPGYSDYIHPLGDNHLITIGKDTIMEDGFAWYQGLQLSIFDISDFSDPQLQHKELIGDRGTNSEALDNHKAFTFWAENGLLAIPVELYEHQSPPLYPSSWGEHTFSGLYVYRITIEDGFEYLGRISTGPATSQTYYNSNWLRGFFIEEDVYAVNQEAVRSAPVENIEGSVSELPFPNGD